jgi:WD40 repeat protein
MTSKDKGQRSIFKCHYGTTYNVQTVPGDCNTFLSCGEDGTIRFFDLRRRSSCLQSSCCEVKFLTLKINNLCWWICVQDVILSWEGAVTTMAVNQMRPYQLAAGCSDSTVRIFDRRMLITQSAGESLIPILMDMFACLFALGNHQSHIFFAQECLVLVIGKFVCVSDFW